MASKRISKRAGRRLHVDSRDWANLHDDLLHDVLEKLPLPDCFALACVCKPWNNVATNYLGGCGLEIPCFVKSRQNELNERKSNNILENSNFEMELPEAYGKSIFGSFKDWLFLTQREKSRLDISLLNPFSGENIMLPSTSVIDHLMVLSAAPTNDNCICLIVGDVVIAFWTPGAKQWHRTQLSSLHVLDALFYEGCFYLLYRFNEIVVINEKDVVSMLNNESGDNVPYQTLSVKLPDYPDSNLAQRYLVESCGEILLVSRYLVDANLYETYVFGTYKLDLHKMAWLKLENLENQILFVGSCCSRSFSTKDLGDAFAEKVYFINDTCCVSHNQFSTKFRCGRYNQNSDDRGVFCTQKPNHWPSAIRAKVKRWAGVWLTAPISWCLKQRRC